MGLTGGIATGKSTCVELLKQDSATGAVMVFCADTCVHELYGKKELCSQLSKHFGEQVLKESGEVDRAVLRDIVLSDPKDKQTLEDLIHPLVRKECLAMLSQASKNESTSLFIADVPLLFEGNFTFGQTKNIVVATSEATQVLRLKRRNSFDDVTVHAILEAQLPINEKLSRGDIVFWNEGNQLLLRKQVRRFLSEHGCLNTNLDERRSINNKD